MGETALLLVEGRDDVCVVSELLERHHIPERFRVEERGGISRLLGGLAVALKGSELTRLGIVVDANADLEGRWAQICTILQDSGKVKMPKHPESQGTIVQVERPEGVKTVGIWLMPDNTLPGMLEHFVSFLIPENDCLWPRAQESVERIPETERRFHSQHLIKAYVHTWLAWQKDPGTPMGQAINNRYLEADSKQAQRFIAWVRRLFES